MAARCYATLYLLTLQPHDVATVLCVVNQLRHSYESVKRVAGARVRDFGNSLVHRVKTRALQAILVILPVLEEVRGPVSIIHLEHAQNNSIFPLKETKTD